MLPTETNLTVVVLLAMVIASFLNVVIQRLPAGFSLVRPRSRCDVCLRELQWRDLIPVIAYLLLRGRCRYCQYRIPIFHLVTEILYPIIAGVLYLIHGLSWVFLSYAIFAAILMCIGFIDWRNLVIPNSLVVTGFAVAAIYHFFIEASELMQIALGLVSGLFILWLAGVIGKFLFHKESMGGGDIKFAAMLGFFAGWQGILLIVWIASLAGAIYGIAGIFKGRKDKENKIPFGSFLSIAAIVYLLPGDSVFVSWIGFP